MRESPVVLRTAVLLLALAGAAAAQDEAKARDLLSAAGRILRPLKTFKVSLDHSAKNSPEPTFISLAFKRPSLWHFERAGRPPSVSVNDGTIVWSTIPAHLIYTSGMDYNNGLDFHGGALALLFFFPDGGPILEGASAVHVRKEKLDQDDCDVITVERKNVQSNTEVWIDAGKKLRKQVFRQHIVMDKGPIDTELTWSYGEQTASPELADELFVYTPPEDFKAQFPRPRDPSLLPLGGPCPDLELLDLAGKKFKLSDTKKKTLVLLFWSEKVVDLAETFEALDRLQADNPEAAFVALNSGTPAKGIKDLLGKAKPAARIALQKTDEGSKAFGVVRYPTTYVISGDRMIAARSAGFSEILTRQTLKVLAEKK
jgi:outer membrane lipoprotein-sorting protein